jgi:signal transduction histidine kinase
MAPVSDGHTGQKNDGEFLGRLCHDLRQPLVVAVGYVSMLEEGAFGELPAEAVPILRTVAERLDAINAIIDGIAGDAKERRRDGPGSD